MSGTMTDKGTIYLAGQWLEGVPGMIEVPAETLVALFTLQYCQNQCIGVVLVTSRVESKTCKFPVRVESLCFGVEVKGDEECPEVLQHCELPAMIPHEEEGELVRKQHEKGTEKQKRYEEEMRKQHEEKDTEKQKRHDDKIREGKNYQSGKDSEEEKEGNEEAEENDGSQTVDKGNEELENEEEGGRNEDSDKVKIGPWCCAGLCSSLRLAVQQLTDTRTLENNRHNKHNTDRTTEHKSNNRMNAKRRKDKSDGSNLTSSIKASPSIACNTAGNTKEDTVKVSNTSDSDSFARNTHARTRNTRDESNTACNTNIGTENKTSISNTPGNTEILIDNTVTCNTPTSKNTAISNTYLAMEHKSNIMKIENNESNTPSNTKINPDHKNNINTKNNKTISDTNLSNKADTPHYAASLLGFRGGCLQACAEVSVWTKFCEVEAPLALLSMALAHGGGEDVEYPEELVRYECHLRRPPILHNALKRTQRQIKATVKDASERDEMLRRPLAQLPPLSHQYAEGPDMTLADLMLFSCFHVLLTNLTSLAVDPVAVTPLVSTWHSTMVLNKQVQMALPVLEGAKSVYRGTLRSGVSPRVVIPSVPDVSIYKSDPERSKASRGAFTKQGEVEGVLSVVGGAGVEPQYIPWPPHSTSSTSIFTSTSQPVPLHTLLQALSLEGHIPESRSARKAEQVENMCSAVLALSCPGDVIVDFCSGGGHVGIPLAQCLPQCHILLVENKVPSLQRARERVRGLRLSNVSFVQTNLDYFRGVFNIGVSLHACGVATDLVLGKCLAQGAAFVVAPCCYGSIQPNHIVSYPRSQAFRSLLTLAQYLILGHAADQTHGRDNPKTEQGQRCMRLVDGDRLAAVREAGYVTGLALMHPPTCSPKNHLLLGKPATPRPLQMS